MRKDYCSGKISYLVVSVLILGIAGAIIQACRPCKCPEPLPFFHSDKITAEVFEKQFKPDTSIVKVNDSAKLNWNNSVFYIRLFYSYHAVHQFTFPTLFNTANACDCRGNGEKGADEALKAITVVTENNWNTQYQSGDTLNDMVTIGGKSLPQVVLDYNNSSDWTFMPVHEMLFSAAPDAEQWLKVKVVFQFKTYSLEAESYHFWILP